MSFVFKAQEYPESPGCYLMMNEAGRIIYVGKAKNLRNRLRSYFQQKHTRKRTRQLVQEIAKIEVVLVNNETESLLLENNLIKIHKPPYNRALKKDNSGYGYLQLTAERLPRLEVFYRNRRAPAHADSGHAAGQEKESSAYGTGQRLGPFRSRWFSEALLEFVTEHYGLRTCVSMPKRACLLYHFGKCSGVCEGNISEEEYRDRARQAAEMLDHQGQALLDAMTVKMQEYAEKLQFEKAQNMLRHIRNLERVPEKQIVDRGALIDQDVLYFGDGGVMVAKVQEGMLRDFQLYELNAAFEEIACDQFLLSRYADDQPDELILNRIGDLRQLRSSLRRSGAKVPRITQPKRGVKYDLLQLCKNNYDYRMNRQGDM